MPIDDELNQINRTLRGVTNVGNNVRRTSDATAGGVGAIQGWNHVRNGEYQRRRGNGFREEARADKEEINSIHSGQALAAARGEQDLIDRNRAHSANGVRHARNGGGAHLEPHSEFQEHIKPLMISMLAILDAGNDKELRNAVLHYQEEAERLGGPDAKILVPGSREKSGNNFNFNEAARMMGLGNNNGFPTFDFPEGQFITPRQIADQVLSRYPEHKRELDAALGNPAAAQERGRNPQSSAQPGTQSPAAAKPETKAEPEEKPASEAKPPADVKDIAQAPAAETSSRINNGSLSPEQVMALQRVLVAKGEDISYNGGPADGVDGKWGDRTEAAFVRICKQATQDPSRVDPRTSGVGLDQLIAQLSKDVQAPEQALAAAPEAPAAPRILSGVTSQTSAGDLPPPSQSILDSIAQANNPNFNSSVTFDGNGPLVPKVPGQDAAKGIG